MGSKAGKLVGRIRGTASVISIAFTGSIAIYEYNTGYANTHTFVDFGVAVVTTAISITALTFGTPVFALGVLTLGTAYGISAAFGSGEIIDLYSNDWGKQYLYGN